jgi:hypothetical protein
MDRLERLLERLEARVEARVDSTQDASVLMRPGVPSWIERPESEKRTKFALRWDEALACWYQYQYQSHGRQGQAQVHGLPEPDWAELQPPANFRAVAFRDNPLKPLAETLEPPGLPDLVYEQMLAEQRASLGLSDQRCTELLQTLYTAIQLDRRPPTACSSYGFRTNAANTMLENESDLEVFARMPLLRRLLLALGLESSKFEPRRVMLARAREKILAELKRAPAGGEFVELFRTLRAKAPDPEEKALDSRLDKLQRFTPGVSRPQRVAEAVVIMQFEELVLFELIGELAKQAYEAQSEGFREVLLEHIEALDFDVRDLSQVSFELERDHSEGLDGDRVAFRIQLAARTAQDLQTQLESRSLATLLQSPGMDKAQQWIRYSLEVLRASQDPLEQLHRSFEQEPRHADPVLPSLSKARAARSNVASQDEADQQFVDFLLEKRAVFGFLGQTSLPAAVLTRACRVFKVRSADEVAQRLGVLLTANFMAEWLARRDRQGAPTREQLFELYAQNI